MKMSSLEIHRGWVSSLGAGAMIGSLIFLGLLAFQGGSSLDTVITKGVVFDRTTDLAFSAQSHVLVLTFDLRQVFDQLDAVFKMTVTAAKRAREKPDPLTALFVHETLKIAKTVNDSIADLRNFQLTFEREKPAREKRSLFGWVIGRSLGLATDDELQDLVDQINMKDVKTHTMINQLVSHISVTDKQLARLVKAAENVNSVLTGLTQHLHATDEIMAGLRRDIVLAQTLNILAFSAVDIQQEVIKIISAVERQLQVLRISPLFLPPNVFVEILTKLQDDVQLLRPPTSKFLPFHYEQARLSLDMRGDTLYFFLELPLKADSQQFSLYQITPLWYPLVNSSWSRKVETPDKFLAVRSDFKIFALLQDLSACVVSNTLTVCSPTTNFLSLPVDNCAVGLFANATNIDDYCLFAYKQSYSPFFLKNGEGWIATTPQVISAKEVCPTTTRHIEIPRGISQFSLQENCGLVGNNFKLESQGKTLQQPREVVIVHDYTIPDVPLSGPVTDAISTLQLSHVPSFTATQLAMLAQTPPR